MESSSDERRRSPAAILRSLGISPRKGLGQNFLHDAGVVRRIVESARLPSDATVVEIGPGLGILTSQLAIVARQVLAIEKDATLASHLRATMPDNVSVIESDALAFDFREYSGQPAHVVANLPYNVGNAILRRLLETVPPFESITVMVQREVAERIVASPPDMSLLAVAVQFFGSARVVMRVGKGAFLPPPNVESAVIYVATHQPPLPAEQWLQFFDVVRAGFSTRRKQLVNTLSTGLGMTKDEIVQALQATSISPSARAETLSVMDWVGVFEALNYSRFS